MSLKRKNVFFLVIEKKIMKHNNSKYNNNNNNNLILHRLKIQLRKKNVKINVGFLNLMKKNDNNNEYLFVRIFLQCIFNKF